ncbi:Leucine-rich repeat - like 10 [Theobroma cacao]|nr:Leucine-rich repeat - like 10 [Theobroma cacao]
MTRLVTLDLSTLNFPGDVPLKLEKPNLRMLAQNLSKLQELYLDGVNDLSVIHLDKNNLSSTMPKFLAKFSNLTSLRLSSCGLHGLFPKDILQITRLELASCGLKVFPDLKNQARLTYLDLSDNQISGEVPNWIWNVGNGLLQHLNLSFDQLVSLQKPYQIPGLSVLDLHSNKLSGNIPTLPPSASYLDYSRNIFTSSLPPNISSCLSCTIFFSLSSNGLKGFIPNSICDAGYLQVLDLSNSSLTGAIPKCLIERIVSLGVPNLRGNSLSGNIPDAFLSHCSIQTLNVNGYELEGKIPRSLARCKMLEVLDLGNNRISDSFPCHLKNISTLRILVLRANEFHGKIGCPAIMAPRPKHQIVDIAHHSFNGRLPEKWLTTWEAMMGDDDQAQLSVKHLQFEVLKLTQWNLSSARHNSYHERSNNGAGAIPPSLRKLQQLESLDLSSNNLCGSIPQQLAKLNFLAFLDLSHNQLGGRIPKGNQFRWLSDDSFDNNGGLCGPPLEAKCQSPDSPSLEILKLGSRSTRAEAGSDIRWNFISADIGFFFGLGIVIASPYLLEEMEDMVL